MACDDLEITIFDSKISNKLLLTTAGSSFSSKLPINKKQEVKDSDATSSEGSDHEEEEEDQACPLVLMPLKDKEKISLCNGLADAALRLKVLTIMETNIEHL